MQPSNVKACCADLYQSDLARLILGDTLHPGGLALTNRLGKLTGIRPGDWVVDLACGRGASAMALSRAFQCKVAGIEFGAAAVRQARVASLESPESSSVFFIQGDAESPPLQPSSVEAVICECSMSVFPDKVSAVQEVVKALRSGGRLGISDVTLESAALPEELTGILGKVLCLSDALNVPGYVQLLEQGGLVVQHQEDASEKILTLLDGLEARLRSLLAWPGIPSTVLAGQESIVQMAPAIIAQLRNLVRDGNLGYWLLVAQKPGD